MRIADAAVPLERDAFMRSLLRELTAALEEVVGVEEAVGYIGLVGQRVGDLVSDLYVRELGLERLDRRQVADVLVDFKKRIKGDFTLVSEDEDRIVLANRCCPLGEKVYDRESLCMLTSSLLGNITARHLGYAKVELVETIARRQPGCRIVIHLRRGGSAAARAQGDEYFGAAVPVPEPQC